MGPLLMERNEDRAAPAREAHREASMGPLLMERNELGLRNALPRLRQPAPLTPAAAVVAARCGGPARSAPSGAAPLKPLGALRVLAQRDPRSAPSGAAPLKPVTRLPDAGRAPHSFRSIRSGPIEATGTGAGTSGTGSLVPLHQERPH